MALTQPKLKIELLHPTSFDHLCNVARYNIHSLIPKPSQLPPPLPLPPNTHTCTHTFCLVSIRKLDGARSGNKAKYHLSITP